MENDIKSQRVHAHEILDKLFLIQARQRDEVSKEARESDLLQCMSLFSELIHENFSGLLKNYQNFFLKMHRQLVQPDRDQAVDANLDDATEETWRIVISQMLKLGFPLEEAAAYRLADALVALNYGETRAVLKPVPTNKKGQACILAQLRFLAVLHAHHLKALGKTLTDARDIVSESYGYAQFGGGNTIRTWENRELKRDFLEIELLNYKEMVRKGSPEIFLLFLMFPLEEMTEKNGAVMSCGELYQAASGGQDVSNKAPFDCLPAPLNL